MDKEQCVRGFKVFGPDWTCNPRLGISKQYTCPGRFQEYGEIEVCGHGMHFCKKAADCFGYYDFNPAYRVAEVVVLDTVTAETIIVDTIIVDTVTVETIIVEIVTVGIIIVETVIVGIIINAVFLMDVLIQKSLKFIYLINHQNGHTVIG